MEIHLTEEPMESTEHLGELKATIDAACNRFFKSRGMTYGPSYKLDAEGKKLRAAALLKANARAAELNK